jgi:hypothetical protein
MVVVTVGAASEVCKGTGEIWGMEMNDERKVRKEKRRGEGK